MANKDLCGWVKPTPSQFLNVAKSLPMPIFSDVYKDVKGSGAGKTVILSDYVKKLTGKHIGQIQKIGDCVSFGAAHAVDHTYCTEIVVKGDREEWITLTSTEDIYGGSRIQIGNGQLGRSDGSIGAWAAKYVNEYGTLIRIKYEHDDLTVYDSSRAKDWGNPGRGTPEYLFPEAKKHTIKTVSLVQTYEEVRDAIANGYAVTVASNQGFSSTRDSDGFLKPYGTWGHQMCLIGVDDSFSRKGVLCLNSWPYNWVSGPTRYDMPPGSFWIDADVLEERMLSMGDSWVYSDREGFPIKKLNLRIV
jgi:hypothetical protein